MAEGSVLGPLGGTVSNLWEGGLLNLIIIMTIGLLVLGIIIAFTVWLVKRKQWNLDVEFKFPRSDGRIVISEWGKGSYNTKRGAVMLKRKGKKPVGMKPFDVKRYLQGQKILTVVQVGTENYIPVEPSNFVHMKDDETGEEVALLELNTDNVQTKSWKSSFERDSKQAYTIMNLLQQYANFIGIGLILMMQLIGFAILYTRVT